MENNTTREDGEISDNESARYLCSVPCEQTAIQEKVKSRTHQFPCSKMSDDIIWLENSPKYDISAGPCTSNDEKIPQMCKCHDVDLRQSELCSNLQKQLADCQEEVNAYSQGCSELVKGNADLTEKLKEAEKNTKGQMIKLNKCLAQLLACREWNKDLAEVNTNLKQRLQISEDNVKQLRTDVKAAEERCDEKDVLLNDAISNLDAKVDKVKADLIASYKRPNTKQCFSKTDEAKIEEAALDEQPKPYDPEFIPIGNLSNEKESPATPEMASEKSNTDTPAYLNRRMEEAMTTMHNENEKLRNQIKEMENDSRKRTRENKALVDFLQVKIATLRANVEVEEYCRKEQEGTIASLQKQVEKTKVKVREAEKIISKDPTKHNQYHERVPDPNECSSCWLVPCECSPLQLEVDEYRSELAECRNHITHLADKNKGLEMVLEIAKDQIENFRTKISELNKQIDYNKSKLQLSEDELSRARKSGSLTTELRLELVNKESLEKDTLLKKTEGELAEARSKLKKERRNVDDLEKRLGRYKAKVDQLEKEKVSTTSDIDDEVAVAELEKQLGDIKSILLSDEANTMSIKQELISRQKRIVQLQTKLSELGKEQAKVKSLEEQLKSQYDELTKVRKELMDAESLLELERFKNKLKHQDASPEVVSENQITQLSEEVSKLKEVVLQKDALLLKSDLKASKAEKLFEQCKEKEAETAKKLRKMEERLASEDKNENLVIELLSKESTWEVDAKNFCHKETLVNQFLSKIHPTVNRKRSQDDFNNEENQKPKRQCLSVLNAVQNSGAQDDIVTNLGTENQAEASPSDTESDTKQNDEDNISEDFVMSPAKITLQSENNPLYNERDPSSSTDQPLTPDSTSYNESVCTDSATSKHDSESESPQLDNPI
ncbi:hypothetical protein Ddc_00011 [Ditylenchus destructor]|nr:hypothetical protein Ddc_00011 [Ditylenchus destructor]